LTRISGGVEFESKKISAVYETALKARVNWTNISISKASDMHMRLGIDLSVCPGTPLRDMAIV